MGFFGNRTAAAGEADELLGWPILVGTATICV